MAERNYRAAQQFLKEVACDYSEADRQAAETLVSQRRILYEMTAPLVNLFSIKSPKQGFIESIQKRCDALCYCRNEALACT